jgi:small conductance mechanosensitive channel
VIVPRKSDLATALVAIGEEVAAVEVDPVWADAVLEAPEILGVNAMGVDNVTVRVSTKTSPDQRLPLAREMRSRISLRLQRDGVVAESSIPPREDPTPES